MIPARYLSQVTCHNHFYTNLQYYTLYHLLPFIILYYTLFFLSCVLFNKKNQKLDLLLKKRQNLLTQSCIVTSDASVFTLRGCFLSHSIRCLPGSNSRLYIIRVYFPVLSIHSLFYINIDLYHIIFPLFISCNSYT